MSKGSGRRRITPSDGLQYDPETDMTNIEERGGSHAQTANKELLLGLRTGAPPTKDGYGRGGHRYAGKGRKDDNRNWKSHTRGKQYEHNALAQLGTEDNRPVPEGVARRLREKSINADVKIGIPCKAFSRGRMIKVTDEERQWAHDHSNSSAKDARIKETPKPSWWSTMRGYVPRISQKSEPSLMKLGFQAFEEKVKVIERRIRYGY